MIPGRNLNLHKEIGNTRTDKSMDKYKAFFI